MKINSVENQSFNGRVCVIGQNKLKELKQFANELNKMNIVKNSDYDFYIACGRDFFKPEGLCVKVLAKLDGFKKSDFQELVMNGENATLNVGSIKSAIERTLDSVF
ncbi:hypothetical protein J6S88_06785 [bacterium]|nr:hypothetical protein [bacterium]